MTDKIRCGEGMWWFNFLYELDTDTILYHLAEEFAKHGATLVSVEENGMTRVEYITFEKEADRTWFLLRYS